MYIVIAFCMSSICFQCQDTLKARIENGLWWLDVVSGKADSLSFYLDTGGLNYLYPKGLKALKVAKRDLETTALDTLSRLFLSAGIPIEGLKDVRYLRDRRTEDHGMLGRGWFDQSIWEMDYAAQELILHTRPPKHDMVIEQIHLSKRSSERRSLARIQVVIEGDSLPLLLDTGAQGELSLEASRALEKEGLMAISFIQSSVFQHWRDEHPDWLYFAKGDRSLRRAWDIIVVPQVNIGQQTIGPVAFAERNDFNFMTMSRWFVDGPVVGALGGNALQYISPFFIDLKSRERQLVLLPAR